MLSTTVLLVEILFRLSRRSSSTRKLIGCVMPYRYARPLNPEIRFCDTLHMTSIRVLEITKWYSAVSNHWPKIFNVYLRPFRRYFTPYIFPSRCVDVYLYLFSKGLLSTQLSETVVIPVAVIAFPGDHSLYSNTKYTVEL